MVAYPGHILESTKGIDIKPGTNISHICHLSLLVFIKGAFCHILVYKGCWITNSVFYRQLAFVGAFIASSDFLVFSCFGH